MSYYCLNNINAEDVFSDVPFFDKYISSYFYINKEIAPGIVLVDVEIFRNRDVGVLKLTENGEEILCRLLGNPAEKLLIPDLKRIKKGSPEYHIKNLMRIGEIEGVIAKISEIESECFQQLKELKEFHKKGVRK